MLAHFLLKGYLKFAIGGISYVNGTDRLSRITKQWRAPILLLAGWQPTLQC